MEPLPRPRYGIRMSLYRYIAGREEFQHLNEAVDAAKLQVPIAAEYSHADAGQAHKRLAAGHLRGMIVLRVREGTGAAYPRCGGPVYDRAARGNDSHAALPARANQAYEPSRACDGAEEQHRYRLSAHPEVPESQLPTLPQTFRQRLRTAAPAPSCGKPVVWLQARGLRTDLSHCGR